MHTTQLVRVVSSSCNLIITRWVSCQLFWKRKSNNDPTVAAGRLVYPNKLTTMLRHHHGDHNKQYFTHETEILLLLPRFERRLRSMVEEHLHWCACRTTWSALCTSCVLWCSRPALLHTICQSCASQQLITRINDISCQQTKDYYQFLGETWKHMDLGPFVLQAQMLGMLYLTSYEWEDNPLQICTGTQDIFLLCFQWFVDIDCFESQRHPSVM